MQEEFRVGSALGKGFQIWFRNLPAFLVLAILVYTPIIVYTAVITRGPLLGQTETLSTYALVTFVLQVPLNLIMTAAVLYGTIQQLRGRPAGIGRSIAFGMKRLLPVLGLGLLGLLMLVLWLVVMQIPGGWYFLPALMVPALVLTCMFYVAVPVAVVERPGTLGALRRSRALTAGHKVSIFGIVLLLAALTLVSNAPGGMFEEDTMTDHELKLSIWIGLGLNIGLGALSAVINSVVYRDLRAAKEGVDNEDIARVFE